MVVQSIAFSVTDALLAFEQQVMDAPLTGLVLRYGKFYGPGTGFDVPASTPPTVHVDAAADAARRAVTRGSAGVYVVADAAAMTPSDRAIRALGWDAAFRIDV